VADRYADPVTRHTVQIEPQQHVTYICHVISQSDNKHRYSWEIWYLAKVFNPQGVALAGSVFGIGTEGTQTFPGKKI
jgi:hypothetical protein